MVSDGEQGADDSDQLLFDDQAGWVTLKQLISPTTIAEVLADCCVLAQLPAEEQWPRDRSMSGTQHLAGLDRRSAAVERIADDGRLRSVVGQLLGPEPELFQAELRNPGPGHGEQKLHADTQPLAGHPPDVATAIIALVDFTETNGATRLVPGSHRRPDLLRRSGSLASHPDEITLIGPAGTAFLFTGHLLHSGTENKSADDRPALQLLWRTPRR